MDRRDFLKKSGAVVAGASGALSLPVLGSCTAEAAPSTSRLAGTRWGMVIDMTRCREGCTACMEACRTENNVAFFGDRRWDLYWIRQALLQPKEEPAVMESREVIRMCNQCDDPPCAMVCPVQATFKREDGIVMVDQHRCIGCRYCMIACPYNARFFNWRENPDWPNKDYPRRSHGVAESCNFCAHLLDGGGRPACVEACEREGQGALIFGDLNDPDSEVSRVIADGGAKRIREDWGTQPKVYYLGL